MLVSPKRSAISLAATLIASRASGLRLKIVAKRGALAEADCRIGARAAGSGRNGVDHRQGIEACGDEFGADEGGRGSRGACAPETTADRRGTLSEHVGDRGFELDATRAETR
jgi:hypothetical protein